MQSFKCYSVFAFALLLFIGINDVGSTTPHSKDEKPIVETQLGKIKGSVLESRLGASFFAFRGIRYGKAPIGKLRFKNPEPVEKWDDIFDATNDGPICPQYSRDNDTTEDCLRLNVYTRELPQSSDCDDQIKKPVILFLHPGGFYFGSGHSTKSYAGPENLMDRNVVLVTINYRLSSLGFLSTGTIDAPGNAGFKDQVLALRWIQSHIVKFGGDPDLVTIMGYSAGGASVTLHMVSPMSKGLFHRAIAMSGSAIAQWDTPPHQIELAKLQAKLLNCSDTSISTMMECFHKKSADEYVNNNRGMFEFGGGGPIYVWSAVVENDFGQERFLIENPTVSYQRGDFAKIPVITGITKYEFFGVAIGVVESEEQLEKLDKNFTIWAPICFIYERNTPRSHYISNELKKEFLNHPVVNDEQTISGLADLVSDSVIGFGVHRFAKLTANFTPVYYYRNSYVGRFSNLYYPEDKPYGTVHHDDLTYLFGVKNVAPLIKESDPENLTIERMTRMWESFAYTGNPNKKDDEILQNLNWEQLRTDEVKLNYLDIGNELKMKKGLNTERYNVWERLFPLNECV